VFMIGPYVIWYKLLSDLLDTTRGVVVYSKLLYIYCKLLLKVIIIVRIEKKKINTVYSSTVDGIKNNNDIII